MRYFIAIELLAVCILLGVLIFKAAKLGGRR